MQMAFLRDFIHESAHTLTDRVAARRRPKRDRAIFVPDIALYTVRGSCYHQVLTFKVHQPGREELGDLPGSHS